MLHAERTWELDPREEEWWAARWGNPVLVRLGAWAVSSGATVDLADALVEAVWSFHSYTVYPTFGEIITTGLKVFATPGSEAAWTVECYLPQELSERMRTIRPALSVEAVAERGSAVSLTVSWKSRFEIDQVLARGRFASQPPRYFAARYIDDLRRDLDIALDSDEADAWFRRPSVLLGGFAPDALLGDPRDLRLRDLLMTLHHGLPQ